MYNPSTSKKFKAPVGRIAQVQKIQGYSKTHHVKVEDYMSSNPRRCPKFDAKKKEYGLDGIERFPQIHQNVPQLQNGKLKKSFKENDIFELSSNKKVCKCKGKSTCGGVKKQPKQKKEKKLVLKYTDKFHTA